MESVVGRNWLNSIIAFSLIFISIDVHADFYMWGNSRKISYSLESAIKECLGQRWGVTYERAICSREVGSITSDEFGPVEVQCKITWDGYDGICGNGNDSFRSNIATIRRVGDAPKIFYVEHGGDDPKNNGKPQSCGVGNPINPATGGKFQAEFDIMSRGNTHLTFARYYNSRPAPNVHHWTHTYSRHLQISTKWEGPVVIPQSVKSSNYTTPQTACLSGWNEIKPKIAETWITDATVRYAGELCEIVVGERVIRILAVRTTNTPLPVFVPLQVAKMVRDDGQVLTFRKISDRWVTDANVPEQLFDVLDTNNSTRIGWEFRAADGSVENYNDEGKLTAVSFPSGFSYQLVHIPSPSTTIVKDNFGREMTLTFDGERLASVTDNASQVYKYDYDNSGHLTAVHYPDESIRQYLYEDTRFPNALTGIIDENNARYATWAYRADGRAILSEHAQGAERVKVTYGSQSATVQYALGQSRTFHFELLQGSQLLTRVVGGPCPVSGDTTHIKSYNDAGYLERTIDFNDSTTTYVSNSQGLELERTEASGTPHARTISTEWNPLHRTPTRITSSDRLEELNYDDQGKLRSRLVRSIP